MVSGKVLELNDWWTDGNYVISMPRGWERAEVFLNLSECCPPWIMVHFDHIIIHTVLSDLQITIRIYAIISKSQVSFLLGLKSEPCHCFHYLAACFFQPFWLISWILLRVNQRDMTSCKQDPRTRKGIIFKLGKFMQFNSCK